MTSNWFQRAGWFHLPVSLTGGIICLLALGFGVTVFLAVDRHSHSVSDTLTEHFHFTAARFCCRTGSAAGPAASESPV